MFEDVDYSLLSCLESLNLEYYLLYSLDDELIDVCQSDLMFKSLTGSSRNSDRTKLIDTKSVDTTSCNTKSMDTKVTRIESCFGGHDEMLLNVKVINLLESIANDDL